MTPAIVLTGTGWLVTGSDGKAKGIPANTMDRRSHALRFWRSRTRYQTDVMTKTRTSPICTSSSPSLLRGLTPVSIAASLFAMLLLGMVVQIGEVVLHIPEPIAEHPLALPAIWIMLLLFLVAAIAHGVSRLQILTKPELLCVFYALLLAAPLMTQGFWHRIVSITATIPRNVQNYDKIDALSDSLWPHGANVLADGFARPQVTTSGQVTWAATEYKPGVVAVVPTLANVSPGEAATLRARIPIHALVPGEPYLISVLARAKDLGPNARYVARLHVDGTPIVTEVFSSAALGKATALQPQGFVRVGAYNVKLPEAASTFVELEFSLIGDGRVELADPKMLNVAALEALYKGKSIIRESDFLQLPPNQRAGFIVKPDNMWSLKGVSFLLAGYIPIRDWLIPLAVWGSFLLLLLLAFVAVNSLLRRQWLDNERYLMPIAKIPQALLGDEPLALSAFTSIWHSRWMWGGLILGLLWGVAKHLSRIDPDLFDPFLTMDLRAYLSSPSFGETFTGVRFEVNPLLLAMCLFMELNVLLSLVCGFWLFRAQFWLGHINAWSVDPQYPYRNEQV
ncbi:MAG: hypothetical protein K8R88_08655, partial [Armatimonadetes bacterium]|nr:hypothetical protein [Armatimonadota bacterium]